MNCYLRPSAHSYGQSDYYRYALVMQGGLAGPSAGRF